MPKRKTHKSAAKRFRFTASGKIRRRHANKSHIMTCKSPKRKRRLRLATLVSKHDTPRVRKMISK